MFRATDAGIARIDIPYERFGAFINGSPVTAETAPVEIADPRTGHVWAEVATSSQLAATAIERADRAFREGTWRRLGSAARGVILRRFADSVEKHAPDFARYEVLATGKLLRSTQGDPADVAHWLRFFSGAVEARSGRLVDLDNGVDARVQYEPVGVVVAITPFNGALSLGSWKIVPALATGNSVVVKPPLEAPASSLLLAQLAADAGVPPGVLNVVPGGSDIGTHLVDHDSVALISFTGSTSVARRVGERAGRNLKRFLCEAGGKSAQIIFNDGDLERAAKSAASGIFSNAGQSCVAGSRVLVQSGIADKVVEQLVTHGARVRLGDPFLPDTEMGPLASARQLERVSRMVASAIQDGARCLVGGDTAALPGSLAGGFFYQPTVLTNSTTVSDIWCQEVFGPVVVIERFETERDATRLANDSQYGLAAGVWTNDINRARRVADALEVGTVWVNTYRHFDHRVPFGGYKMSGIGRENGIEVLDEYVNVKSVVTQYLTSDATLA